MPNTDAANVFTLEEIEQLFSDEFEQDSALANEETVAQQTDVDGTDTSAATATEETKPAESNVETTKAFAQRLKKSTDKARQEEREAIAKSLGYASYEELQKSRENKVLEDNGIDPEDGSKAIDEIVRQRIESDPRMQELAKYRRQQIEEFGKKELAEITKLTGGEITSLAQLPKEVIDLWKQKGSLKSAYLELEGEKLITKIRSEHSKGTTHHLQNPSGKTSTNSKRLLNEHEKNIWRQFHPQMTEEELNKITVDTQ